MATKCVKKVKLQTKPAAIFFVGLFSCKFSVKYSSQGLQNLGFCTNVQCFLTTNKVQCATWINSFSNFLTTKHSNLKYENKSRPSRKRIFPQIKAVTFLFFKRCDSTCFFWIFQLLNFRSV